MLDWIGQYLIPGLMAAASVMVGIAMMSVMPWVYWWYPILVFGGLAGMFVWLMTW